MVSNYSSNKTLSINGKVYDYLKEKMQFFIEWLYCNIWSIVKNDMVLSFHQFNDVVMDKPINLLRKF